MFGLDKPESKVQLIWAKLKKLATFSSGMKDAECSKCKRFDFLARLLAATCKHCGYGCREHLTRFTANNIMIIRISFYIFVASPPEMYAERNQYTAPPPRGLHLSS